MLIIAQPAPAKSTLKLPKPLPSASPTRSKCGPAIMAYHYTEAGLSELAAQYWVKAAEQALSRSAYTEANRYVNPALF